MEFSIQTADPLQAASAKVPTLDELVNTTIWFGNDPALGVKLTQFIERHYPTIRWSSGARPTQFTMPDRAVMVDVRERLRGRIAIKYYDGSAEWEYAWRFLDNPPRLERCDGLHNPNE